MRNRRKIETCCSGQIGKRKEKGDEDDKEWRREKDGVKGLWEGLKLAGEGLCRLGAG